MSSAEEDFKEQQENLKRAVNNYPNGRVVKCLEAGKMVKIENGMMCEDDFRNFSGKIKLNNNTVCIFDGKNWAE